MASQKLEFLKQIDKASAMAAAQKVSAAPAAAKAQTTPAASATSKLPGIMTALKDRLAKNPGLGKEIGGTLQFKIGQSAFSISAAGLAEGMSDKRDATLTFTDEDAFTALIQDAAKEQDLYMRGQLRVDGDIFVAKKIGFLNKLV
jgi:3-hydroxyacyl-CoA dehydrogenase/3a,7a,12a-trihydroxy-5b-cholest-24-enoyl-CoA hydratase